MNMTRNPTTAELAALLSRCDDNAGLHQLWVDLEGNVHIDLMPKDSGPLGYAATFEHRERFRYEIYIDGNGYVGPEVAKDQRYVANLLKELKQDWKAGTRGFIDY